LKKYWIIVGLLSYFSLFFSCDYLHLKEKDHTGEVIASVGDKKLYKKDLESLYKGVTDPADSALIANNFIENWAKKQIFLQKAALNLSSDKESELTKMVNEYREDLFINSYKEALVSQNVDSLVSDQTITDFYQSNQTIFRLNEELVKYKELIFRTDSDVDVKEVKKLLMQNTRESTTQLLDDELKFVSLQLNDSVWFPYTGLLQKNPMLQTQGKSKILSKNKLITAKDSVNTHLIFIEDFLERNKIAPLNYVKPVIKQIIFHQKKLTYINELEDQLINEAIQQNIYKKY